MTRFSTITVFALSISLLSGAAAYAEEAARAQETGSIVEHVSVFYGDLDLSRPAGVKVLATRIKHAAAQSCGGRPDNRDLKASARFDTCTREAIGGTARELGNPTLTAMLGLKAPEAVAAK